MSYGLSRQEVRLYSWKAWCDLCGSSFGDSRPSFPAVIVWTPRFLERFGGAPDLDTAYAASNIETEETYRDKLAAAGWRIIPVITNRENACVCPMCIRAFEESGRL